MPLREPAALERRKAAAARLCHDLGKSVRWLAPAVRESSAQALRERLEADLVRTRSGADGTFGAIEIFDGWRREEGALFEAVPHLNRHLDAIARAVDVMRETLPGLSTLDASALSALDDASLEVSREARALREAVSLEPPPTDG